MEQCWIRLVVWHSDMNVPEIEHEPILSLIVGLPLLQIGPNE